MENEVLNNNLPKKSNSKRIISFIAFVVFFIGLILLAIFVLKKPVKISFNAPGVVGFKIDSIVVDKDGKFVVPEKAKDGSMNTSRTYYTFVGWFDNKDGTGDKINLEELVLTKSTTVYAIWDTIQYKIEYDLDGGEFLSTEYYPKFYTVIHDSLSLSDNKFLDSLTETDPVEGKFYQEYKKNTLNEKLVIPFVEKAGKTFDRWQIVDKNGDPVTGVSLDKIRINPTGDIILKAIYK